MNNTILDALINIRRHDGHKSSRTNIYEVLSEFIVVVHHQQKKVCCDYLLPIPFSPGDNIDHSRNVYNSLIVNSTPDPK